MRQFSIIFLVVLAGIFTAMTVCAPEILGSNKFLENFVNHEYINVFIVIVTVSFVSVTQIHLEYSRIERSFKLRVFSDARREVNFGAGLLAILLLTSLPLVMIRAEYSASMVVQSVLNATALLFLVAAVFIMYDFVRTVYVIAAEEPIEGDDDDT